MNANPRGAAAPRGRRRNIQRVRQALMETAPEIKHVGKAVEATMVDAHRVILDLYIIRK